MSHFRRTITPELFICVGRAVFIRYAIERYPKPLNIGRYNASPKGLYWVTIIFVFNSEGPSLKVIPHFTLSWKTPEVKLAIIYPSGRYVREDTHTLKYFNFEFPNRNEEN